MQKILFLTLFLTLTGNFPMASNHSEDSPATQVATFAGGCFWCMQPPFDNCEGVLQTQVGYMGGSTDNPTYEEVCQGNTGHAEVIHIVFDPSMVTYEKLLEIFWQNIDPTTLNQQFADRGTQYRTAIFYHNEEQKAAADKSKVALDASQKFKSPVVTTLEPAGHFYVAENYHQKYYEKSPVRYKMYKTGSGRQNYLEKTWKK